MLYGFIFYWLEFLVVFFCVIWLIVIEFFLIIDIVLVEFMFIVLIILKFIFGFFSFGVIVVYFDWSLYFVNVFKSFVIFVVYVVGIKVLFFRCGVIYIIW